MSDSRALPKYIRQRAKSFGYALRGIIRLFRSEPHAWIHLLAATAVIALGRVLTVSAVEWCLLILAIGSVWTAEALNTAVEHTVDLLSPEFQTAAEYAKDAAAGAVLLASLTAAVVGIIVLGPPLVDWWREF